MPTKPTKSTAKISKAFEIRGKGNNQANFRGSVYDFLCKIYNEDIHSDFGRKLFEKLELKFAADGGLRTLCKYQKTHGEIIPTMYLRQLKTLMFRLDDKDVKTARIIMDNINYARLINPTTEKITHETPPPTTEKVHPPTKDQPTYYKLQLIPDQDLIRGVTHTNQDGVTDIYWGVFDFLCVMYEHKTTDSFGRKKFEQINRARDGELEKLVTRIKTRKAAKETLTLTADQLIDLLMMFKHPYALIVREVCTDLERVTNDYSKCAEVTVNEDV